MSGEEDAVALKIVELLKNAGRPLTTVEIEEEVNRLGLKCPDSAARYLNQLRARGQIEGKLSIPRKSWVWWVYNK